VLLLGCPAPSLADDSPRPAQREENLRRHGVDPNSPLESRVQATSPKVLKMFEELGGPAPTAHILTKLEQSKLAAAFAALPPLHRRILTERLRSVSFLDGMPNTALTSTINPDERYKVFDITIRAAILGEDVSEWLTQKERTCFVSADSPLSVSVEAGKLDAILFVLLHEGTHIVDACLGLTPAPKTGDSRPNDSPDTEFTQNFWIDRTTHAPRYRDALLERVRFRAGGEPIPIDQSESLYKALSRTPFVSLYGSSNWFDDVAEYLAVYHMTEVLEQPFRVVIRKKGNEVFVYEPMKSDLVRRRVGQMKRFYEVDK
jgi:hypothetical protein